ncbi:MAG: hypothetical protein AAFY65_16835 [Pseudomonadota bacterium]
MRPALTLLLAAMTLAGCGAMPMAPNEVKITKSPRGYFTGQSGSDWTLQELCDHSFTMLCDDGLHITNLMAAQTGQGDLVFNGWCAG